MPDGCVITRLKMLTYYRVRSTFKTAKALPSGMIWHFENNFKFIRSNLQSGQIFFWPRLKTGFHILI